MAWQQSDLDAIESAIKSGALIVKFSDKQVQYRSLDEMLKIRDLIRKALGATATTGRIFTNFAKGTDTCG